MAPLLHSGIDRGFESLTVHEENLACDADGLRESIAEGQSSITLSHRSPIGRGI
jgi:hypothetical protein